MMGHNYIRREKLLRFVTDVDDPATPLNRMRLAIAVIRYLNYQGTPQVNHRLTNIVNDVHDQWRYGRKTWNGNNLGSPVKDRRVLARMGGGFLQQLADCTHPVANEGVYD